MNRNKRILVGVVCLLILVLLVAYFSFSGGPYQFREDRPIKIAYINSFHFDNFDLTQDNIAAFEKVFDEYGIDIEIRRVDMDTLVNHTEENLMEKSAEAMELIDEWKPDLIYATDDNAQAYVAVNYINSDIPIVFSGVNEDVEVYGYDKAKNVAGVLERIHFVDAIEFAREILPKVEKVVIFSDQYPFWERVVPRFKADAREVDDLEIVAWEKVTNWNDYTRRVEEYQGQVDAFVFLSVNGVQYDNGTIVSDDYFREWTTKNSNVPEITFWYSTVERATLMSVDVSSSEQGRAAGILARKILIDGADPSSLEFKSTDEGERHINLARAESLGIKRDEIPSLILVNSKVYDTFYWEDMGL